MRKTCLAVYFLIIFCNTIKSQPDYLYRDSLGLVLNAESNFITYAASGFTKISDNGDTLYCKKGLPGTKCLNLANGSILFYTMNSTSVTVTKVDPNGNIVFRKTHTFSVNSLSSFPFVFEDISTNSYLFVFAKALIKIDMNGNILFSKKLEVDPNNNPFVYILNNQNLTIARSVKKNNNILLYGTMPQALSNNYPVRFWAEIDMSGNTLSFDVFNGGGNNLGMEDYLNYQNSYVVNSYSQMYIMDNSHIVSRIFFDALTEGVGSVLSLTKISTNNYIALLFNNTGNTPVYKLRNYNFLSNTYQEIELSRIYGGKLNKSGIIKFRKVKTYDPLHVILAGDFGPTSSPYYLRINSNFISDSCFLKYPVTTHSIPSYSINAVTTASYSTISPLLSYTTTTPVNVTLTNRFFKTRTSALVAIESVTVTPPVCFNDNNASVSATGKNGWPFNHVTNPSYALSLYNTSGTSIGLNNLGAGNYTLMIKDSLGCKRTQPVSITNPPAFIPTHSVITSPICFNTTSASVQFTATGGVPSYSVSEINGNSTFSNNNMVNLFSNTHYTITIKDSRNCIKYDTLTIKTLPSWGTYSIIKKNCIYPANSGGFTIHAVNGNYPYVFNVNSPNCTMYPDSAKAINLPPGMYSYTVTDNIGCKVSSSANVYNATPVNVSVTNTIVCNGNDGAIQLSALVDTAFIYQWSVPNQTTSVISNLSPGAYSYTITEENNCQYFGNYTLGAAPFTSIVPNYTTNCNDPVNISANSNYSMNYNWMPPTGVSNQLILNPTILATQSSTYYLYTNYMGCTKSYPVNIHVNYPSNFAYTTNSLSVTFNMTNSNYCNGQGFLWDFGNGMQNTLSNNPSVTYNQTGLYTACLKCGNNVPQACVACTTFSLPSTTNGGTDVGVFEYQNSTLGIKYYPNPNTGNFTIETETEKLITIINILSETILTQQLQKGKNEIDLSNYANGVYFIKAGNSTFKVIKQ